jgi:hypothetical protein
MVQSVRYVTDANGNRVGVLLDLKTYAQLSHSSSDPDLLLELTIEELTALAHNQLSLGTQAQLDQLLERNAARSLTPDEATT